MHFPRPTIIAGLLALGATAAPTEVDPVLFTYTLSFTNSCSKNNFLNPLEFRRSQLPSNGCLVWSDFMGTNQPLKSFTVLETISNGVCSSKLTTPFLFTVDKRFCGRLSPTMFSFTNVWLFLQLITFRTRVARVLPPGSQAYTALIEVWCHLAWMGATELREHER